MDAVSQGRYINYKADRITQHCCHVNLPGTLKARTRAFTSKRKGEKILLESTVFIKGSNSDYDTVKLAL